MTLRLAFAGALLALLLKSGSGWAAPGATTDVALTEQRLGQRQQTNSTRRELAFLDASVGAAYVDLLALKAGELLDSAQAKSSGFGPLYGAALGVRLQGFTLAVRYRYGDFSDWHLWTLGGEAGVNLSLGRIEPYFGFGAAYASLGGLHADTSNAITPNPNPAVDIHGLNLRVSVGLNYYIASWFSVGTSLSGDAFFLHRTGDRLRRTLMTDPNAPRPFPYAIDGSGNGLGIALSLVLGGHY